MPALEDQRPRYSSTPWSERPTKPPTPLQALSSILPLIEPSATPRQLVLRLPTPLQLTKRKYSVKILLELDKQSYYGFVREGKANTGVSLIPAFRKR